MREAQVLTQANVAKKSILKAQLQININQTSDQNNILSLKTIKSQMN